MPYYTYPLLYSITIIIGLFNYRKFKDNKYLKLFLYFLFYTLFTEIMGYFVGIYLWRKNGFVYSAWNILNFLFCSYFVFGYLNSNFKKTIIKFLVVVFVVITVINVSFYIDFFSDSMILNIVLAKFFIVLITILYFIEVLQGDEILNLKKSLYSWILLGYFLYNIGFLPAYTLVEYTSFFGMFKYITFGLNIILHTCIITGFIVSKKEFNMSKIDDLIIYPKEKSTSAEYPK